MKITFETSDDKEALRMIKSLDMASFIFELQNNLWRKFKHSDYDYTPYQDAINQLLKEYNINIDELTE